MVGELDESLPSRLITVITVRTGLRSCRRSGDWEIHVSRNVIQLRTVKAAVAPHRASGTVHQGLRLLIVCRATTDGGTFNKLHFIIETMESPKAQGLEWLLWIDGDAHIANTVLSLHTT